MYLLVDSDKCTGCRTCELACSFRWSNYFKPSDSAITVKKIDGRSINLPVVCQQCARPVCIKVCMSGAIKRSEKTGVISIDETKCTGCKVCVTSCPFGTISFITAKGTLGTLRKCDLCEPLREKRGAVASDKNVTECMRMCPYGAIELLSEGKIAQKMRQKGMAKCLDFAKSRRNDG